MKQFIGSVPGWLAIFVLVLTPGCGRRVEDLVITLSVGGSTARTICTDFDIASWRIHIGVTNEATTTAEVRIDCATGEWTTEGLLGRLLPTTYTVTVDALDGNGNALTDPETLSIDLAFPQSRPEIHNIDVPLSAFGGGTAELSVRWTINGTTDGTDDGPSWDTCAEVGAVTVGITVDGESYDVACDTQGMTETIRNLSTGDKAVEVVLLDSADQALTTVNRVTLAASEDGVLFVSDFFFNSFLEPNKTGTEGSLLYKTTFDGTTCATVAPAVDQTTTLLSLDGIPVAGAQACSVTTPSDCNNAASGTDVGTCLDDTTEIRGLTWGIYRLSVQGVIETAPPPNQNFEICYETNPMTGQRGSFEVLVGAGTENPVADMPLSRLTPAPNGCTP